MKKPIPHPPILAVLVLVLTGLIAVGCQHVNHLREAQNAFNEAAAAEHASNLDQALSDTNRFSQSRDVALASLTASRVGYSAALLSLEQITQQQEKQLQADKLWGVVLTLRALTEWKLERYAAALATVDGAAGSAGQLHPRDAALLHSVPGLIKVDLAFDALGKLSPLHLAPTDANGEELKAILKTNRAIMLQNGITFTNEIAGLLVGPHGAITDLGHARDKVANDHPVNVFLIQSQLAAYRNYEVGFRRTRRSSDDTVRNTPTFSNAVVRVGELSGLLRALNVDAAVAQEATNFWIKQYDLTFQNSATENE